MKKFPPVQLEDIPCIGKSIANDLRGLGLIHPAQLAAKDPLKLYLQLGSEMGVRHDPCVLYTLLAAQHFLRSGEAVKWWDFTEAGKKMLAGLKS